MAQFSLHAYDADVWIEGFKGLNQTLEINGDLRYASEEYNLETPHGVLQPSAGSIVMAGEFADRVETLARFHRRWSTNVGSKDWLICCSGGHFYYKQEGSDNAWEQIPMPAGMTNFESSVWSWVTYEENVVGVDHPVDIMILSNPIDGMIYISPPDRPTLLNDYKDDALIDIQDYSLSDMVTWTWKITRNTDLEVKFGVIERYAERIWGGAIPEDPDMLMYSRAFDPFDWSEDTTHPDKTGGDISQPTWDGDSFTSLKAFGDQLIAFKGHGVWRVYGTNPGEFTFNRQYGGGAPYFNTIAVDIEKIFMCDADGPCVYDGMSVHPYMHDQIDDIWRTVNKNALDQMCGALWKNRYYLAFPTGNSSVNNALLVFDQDEGTILFHKGVYIESLLATPESLYATSSSLPGKVIILKYDSWVNKQASGNAVKWVSPWTDFGYKRITKGGFDLYFAPEVQDEAVTLTVSVQTEKKTKTKLYTVQPLTPEQREADKQPKYKRLHFAGTGRKFRVIIECDEGVTTPWRIVGGLHMVVETDSD